MIPEISSSLRYFDQRINLECMDCLQFHRPMREARLQFYLKIILPLILYAILFTAVFIETD